MIKKFYISGIVQGVGYRYSISRKLRNLQLKGWIRNLPDSRVEVVVGNDNLNFDEIIEILKNSCYSATVTDIEVDNCFESLPGNFEIRF